LFSNEHKKQQHSTLFWRGRNRRVSLLGYYSVQGNEIAMVVMVANLENISVMNRLAIASISGGNEPISKQIASVSV